MVLEKTLESPFDCKEIKPAYPKGNQSWIFIRRTDAEAETPIFWPPDAKRLSHWERPWCWERLKAGREGEDRGWDGWTASLTQWTWVWASSGRWWWTGKPGVLRLWGCKVLDMTEQLNWTDGTYKIRRKMPFNFLSVNLLQGFLCSTHWESQADLFTFI